jgi:hypothetical protein
MADGLYLKGIEQMGLGAINLETDTIHLVPMATTYTPNYTTENFYSDVSASIAAGASEIALTSLAFDIDTGNTRVEFDSADVSETSQTFSSNKFIIKKDTGVDSTSPLICCIEFAEGTLAPVDGDFNVTVNVEGFYSIASS